MNTNTTKSISIKHGNGFIGVKEEYLVHRVMNTNDINVKMLFCVDKNLAPCKLCFSAGNRLFTLGGGSDVDVAAVLKGRSGMYSRLDCVSLVVLIKGTATVREVVNPKTGNKVREVMWHKNPVSLFTPKGFNEDSLLVMSSARELTSQQVLNLSNRILQNLVANTERGGNPIGDSIILTREEFIKNRI